jgi:hypothetical protein
MYSVFTKLGDGEFLFVASREELEQAAQLVQELNANWPNEYVVRDSKGNYVGPKNIQSPSTAAAQGKGASQYF